MANVYLKNRDGELVLHTDVYSVSLLKEDGQTYEIFSINNYQGGDSNVTYQEIGEGSSATQKVIITDVTNPYHMRPLNTTVNGTWNQTNTAYVPVTVNVPPRPVDVSTEAEMTALLTSSNVGNFYRYTGTTTSQFVQNDIYVVEETNAV